MDATAWSVGGSAVAILVAIGASFRSLRDEIRVQARRIDALGEQMGVLRERMAHLEGLLEGLRDAITGKRAA